ncbi:hypothetical protein ACWGDE_36160, partial [Streptomyces sp. NPDC054956]
MHEAAAPGHRPPNPSPDLGPAADLGPSPDLGPAADPGPDRAFSAASDTAPDPVPAPAPAPDGVRAGWKGWGAVCAVALGIFCLITSELLPVGLLTAVGADLGVS